jgi:leader peptidase (prepilin peptidase)/N-methyltransferase
MPIIFWQVIVFILGTIIGSFLNVVIFRFNTGATLGGRSGCFSCGKKLRSWELVPIVSFLSLRGRCSGCKTKISHQYPLVEFFTGFLFLLFFIRLVPQFHIEELFFFFGQLLLSWIIWSVLVVVFVYDLRHKIIPDKFSIAFSVLALLQTVLFFSQNLISHLVAGTILFLFFFAFWFFSKGKWMGFGDAKLALGIGLYLGLTQGVSAIVFGFWIGAVVALGILLKEKIQHTRLRKNSKIITMKSEIPFAPFLILGTLLALLLGSDVLSLHLLFV